MFFIAIAIVFLVTLYLYSTKNFDYWKKRGVKHDPPLPLVGNSLKVFLQQRSSTEHYDDIYRRYPNEKVVGAFQSVYPILIIRDLDIIKRILITDFSHFYARRLVPIEGSPEPLLRSLFNADGDLWRLLRQRLTPAFTSGKLKAMFPLIVERAERLHTRIQDHVGTTVDARDLMARFTTDFIGACGFGVDMDSLENEDSEFRKLGKKITNIDAFDSLKLLLRQLPLKIFKGIKFTGRVESDALSLTSSVLRQRNYKPSGRNDFVDLLLQCKEQGTIVGESMERFKADGTPEKATLEITEDIMAAQMFVFFVAGFETSSSATSYALHMLAYHPDKQKKVQEDIRQAIAKYDNKLCYDAIKDMHYLELTLKESLRLFPSVGFLIRECVHRYKIPELELTIEPGIKVFIPNSAIQTDPKYFDNPEEFRPERFSPEEWDNQQSKFSYLPFGDGPRACIGERLGLMQSMAGLAAVLSKYSVEPAPTSVRQPQVSKNPGIVQTIPKGLPLIFREIGTM